MSGSLVSMAKTVEGPPFQHKIIIIPSKSAMCQAYIRHDLDVSLVKNTFRHM